MNLNQSGFKKYLIINYRRAFSSINALIKFFFQKVKAILKNNMIEKRFLLRILESNVAVLDTCVDSFALTNKLKAERSYSLFRH